MISFVQGALDGLPDLRNVSIFSDRGYLLASLVWGFILAAGAHIVGTIKRAPSWPFNFIKGDSDDNPSSTRIRKRDSRTFISSKGTTALFMKHIKKPIKTLAAFAFRNGTGTVSTAISSLHRHHEWEGISMFPSELDEYEEDNFSLQQKYLSRLYPKTCDDELLFWEEQLKQQTLDTIDPVTLRQGTADWHWARRFSMTSSQTHSAMTAAYPSFKNKPHWDAVMRHLHGPNYKENRRLMSTFAINYDGLEDNADMSHLQEEDTIETHSDTLLSYFENERKKANLTALDASVLDAIIRVLDGDQQLDPINQPEAFTSSFVKAIYDRIPVQERGQFPSRNAIRSTMTKFVLEAKVRPYIGYSKVALEKMLSTSGIVGSGKTIDSMMNALAAGKPPEKTSRRRVAKTPTKTNR